MGIFSVLAPIVGGALGLIGGQQQRQSQEDIAAMQRELPPWLEPYITGPAGPAPQPLPINYNWLDAIQRVAAGGMPEQWMPPMSMNDPRMTFQNVHTPYAGGPWGFGLGPGQPTAEAGIPNAPGSQFLPTPDGFTPGPVAPAPPTPAPAAQPGPGLDPEQINQRVRYMQLAQSGGEGEALGTLQWLGLQRARPDLFPEDFISRVT